MGTRARTGSAHAKEECELFVSRTPWYFHQGYGNIETSIASETGELRTQEVVKCLCAVSWVCDVALMRTFLTGVSFRNENRALPIPWHRFQQWFDVMGHLVPSKVWLQEPHIRTSLMWTGVLLVIVWPSLCLHFKLMGVESTCKSMERRFMGLKT